MEHKKGFYEKYIKRPQDFLCALLACIVLSPVMLLIAIPVFSGKTRASWKDI